MTGIKVCFSELAGLISLIIYRAGPAVAGIVFGGRKCKGNDLNYKRKMMPIIWQKVALLVSDTHG